MGPWQCKGQQTWIVMNDRGILSLRNKDGVIVGRDGDIDIKDLIRYSKPVWTLGALGDIDPALAVDEGL